MKITDKKPGERDTIVVKTSSKVKTLSATDWWNANSKKELTEKLLDTVSFLKQQNEHRMKAASMYARLYGNLPLMGFGGQSAAKLGQSSALPVDRPTMSIITSMVDTLVSKISQARPRPVFLTDNGDYKQRSLAKQMNTFISGMLYQAKAYDLGPLMLRDASVLGSGVLKVLEDPNNRVAFERRLCTELLVDNNDAFYGDPRMIYEVKLVDRAVLADQNPEYRSTIEKAEQAYPDGSGESTRTVSDQVMVAEAWRLPSGPDATDGMHALVTSAGVIFEESWEKDRFPFVFLDYAPRLVGLWGQGVPERQMGTQMGINQLLMTIHRSINLVGVPRVFVEKGSKVVKAHLNNEVGSIVEYSGTKPEYEVAPCVPVELYTQLERLIKYGYQQEGISELAAMAQKPAGLNSGEAQREFEDIQSDRFAALVRRYDKMYNELAEQGLDLAIDIAERDGKYQTVFPNKDGTRQVELPAIKKLKDNPYVIQCFDSSSLPRDPAGRLQRVTEWMQAGIVSVQEGRRLLDFPDLEQSNKLASAGQERIFKILDDIVESGNYNPPDPFMDLQKAIEITAQYYNLYTAARLEEDKAQMLRDFSTQCQTLMQAAMPPAPMAASGAAPIGVPEAPPTSELLPNAPAGA